MAVKDAWKALFQRENVPAGTRPMKGEIGYTGNMIFSGLPMDEYNPDLSFPASTKVYDQMRRSDGQIAAVMSAMKLPIISAEWYIEPDQDAKNKSQAQQIADFIEDNLFGGMKFSWPDHLREGLLMLDFGFSVFEKVWRFDTWQQKNVIMLDKYAPRVAPSIWRFPQNEHGDIVMVQQLNYWTGELLDMPLNKVRMYTYQREGDNPVGISALRAAYKHWYIKDALYRIVAVGVEKGLIGTPYATLPKGTSEEDRQKILATITAMRVAEEAGATIPEGVILGVLEGKNSAINAMPFIEHQDTMISRSVMAQFLNLGTMSSASGGSYALGNTMVGMFLQSLEGIAGYIQGEVQKDINQLVEWNFGSDAPVPQLKHGTISIDSIAEKLSAIGQLGAGHLLNPDESLENALRKMIGVPPIPEAALANQRSLPQTNYVPPIIPDTRLTPAQIAQIQRQQATIGQTGKGPMAPKAPAPAKMHDHDHGLEFADSTYPAATGGEQPQPAGDTNWRRHLTPLEAGVDLAALNAAWQAAEVTMLVELQQTMHKLSRKLFRMMDRALSQTSSSTQAMRQVSELAIGDILEYQEKLVEQLQKAADIGSQSVAKELGGKVTHAIESLTAIIESKARTLAKLQAEKLLSSAQLAALGALERGSDVPHAIRAAKEAANQYIEGFDLKLSSNISVAEALNLGRGETARQKGVQGAQWSAVLDSHTCPLCESLDGKTIAVDNPDFDVFRPPLHGSCRCILVYVGTGQTHFTPDWTTPDAALVKKYGRLIT